MYQIDQTELEEINQQICKSFCLAIAVQCHKFSKKCLQLKQLRLREKKTKKIAKATQKQTPRQTAISRVETQNNALLQLRNQDQNNSQINYTHHHDKSLDQKPENDESYQRNLNQITQSLQDKTTPLTETQQPKSQKNIVYEHFSNELRPKILLKYPMAPMDQVNKVIFQKWRDLQPARKEAYSRRVARKYNTAASQTDHKNEQGMQIETPVKREQMEPPVNQNNEQPNDQNRFENYLERIKHKENITSDKFEHNVGSESNLQLETKGHKSEYGQSMQAENDTGGSEVNQTNQEESSDDTAKMEEERQQNSDE